MLSPFKKATSRRQMLQTSASVLAAPWIASHAASPVADGRTITLVDGKVETDIPRARA